MLLRENVWTTQEEPLASPWERLAAREEGDRSRSEGGFYKTGYREEEQESDKELNFLTLSRATWEKFWHRDKFTCDLQHCEERLFSINKPLFYCGLDRTEECLPCILLSQAAFQQSRKTFSFFFFSLHSPSRSRLSVWKFCGLVWSSVIPTENLFCQSLHTCQPK